MWWHYSQTHSNNHCWWPLVNNIALITGNTQSRASSRPLTVTSPVFMPNSNWALGSFIWAWLGWAMDRFSLQLHTHHPQQQLQHHENRIVQWCTCSNTVTSMNSCTSLTPRPNTFCSFASYSSENILSSNKMQWTHHIQYIYTICEPTKVYIIMNLEILKLDIGSTYVAELSVLWTAPYAHARHSIHVSYMSHMYAHKSRCTLYIRMHIHVQYMTTRGCSPCKWREVTGVGEARCYLGHTHWGYTHWWWGCLLQRHASHRISWHQRTSLTVTSHTVTGSSAYSRSLQYDWNMITYVCKAML